MNSKEKVEYFASLSVLILAAVAIAYLVLSRGLALVLPFLIAWFVAFAVRPAACKISEKLKMPKKWVSLVLSVGLCILCIGAVLAIIAFAVREAFDFISEIANSDSLYSVITKIMNPLSGIFGDREAAPEIEAEISEAIRAMLSSVLSKLASFAGSLVSSVPSVLIFIVITLSATVYFSLDLEVINRAVRRVLPKSVGDSLVKFKNRFMSAGAKYLRSYLIIMLITFFIMVFGFLLLGVKYALLIAAVLAVLDALPLIGVGTLLVPWSIFELLFGSRSLGVGLIVLFAVNEIVRHLAEPKILGKNLGTHPVVTLVLLYVSYSLFGFLGLLLMPLLTVLFNILFNKDDAPEIGEMPVRKEDGS